MIHVCDREVDHIWVAFPQPSHSAGDIFGWIPTFTSAQSPVYLILTAVLFSLLFLSDILPSLSFLPFFVHLPVRRKQSEWLAFPIQVECAFKLAPLLCDLAVEMLVRRHPENTKNPAVTGQT